MRIIAFVLFVTLHFSCQNVNVDNLEKPFATEDFKEYLTTAFEYLQSRQEYCENEYGIGKFERWFYDQQSGLLTFHNGDTTKLKIKYQEVGSVSKISDTWLWAWANPNLMDNIKAESFKVKELGENKSFERLKKRKWNGDEIDGWEMTAITAYLLKAKGAYRVPTEKTFSYFVFTEIERVNEIDDRQ